MDNKQDLGGSFLPAGTKVLCDSPASAKILYGDLINVDREVGVVVHCWYSDEISAYDCYVAFFGRDFPVGQPSEMPYILRYAATSLTVVEQ